MTETVRPVTADDDYVGRELWRAYLAFYKITKPEETHARSRAQILDPATGIFSCLTNFLYHLFFSDTKNRCNLNDLCVSPQSRASDGRAALVDAVVSHAQGRNCASVYWLTAQDNVQARRLYDPVASLTPIVKYQV